MLSLFLSFVLAVSHSRRLTPWFLRSEICSSDAEERAIVIGMMNSMGFAFSAWVPYLAFPAVEGPHFYKGFVFGSCMFVFQFAVTGTTYLMHEREKRWKAVEAAAVQQTVVMDAMEQ